MPNVMNYWKSFLADGHILNTTFLHVCLKFSGIQFNAMFNVVF